MRHGILISFLILTLSFQGMFAQETDPAQKAQVLAKLRVAREKAMEDPQVKATCEVARVAHEQERKVLIEKMKGIDPSIQRLLEKENPTAQEREKVLQLKEAALLDSQIKGMYERYQALHRAANEKLRAKMKELEPSLAPLIDELEAIEGQAGKQKIAAP